MVCLAQIDVGGAASAKYTRPSCAGLDLHDSGTREKTRAVPIERMRPLVTLFSPEYADLYAPARKQERGAGRMSHCMRPSRRIRSEAVIFPVPTTRIRMRKSYSQNRRLVLYVLAESVKPFPHNSDALRGAGFTFNTDNETHLSKLVDNRLSANVERAPALCILKNIIQIHLIAHCDLGSRDG